MATTATGNGVCGCAPEEKGEDRWYVDENGIARDVELERMAAFDTFHDSGCFPRSELVDQIVALMTDEECERGMWRGRALEVAGFRHLADLRRDSRVYRRDLPPEEAHRRVLAARLVRAISLGACRRKEKRLARRHGIAPLDDPEACIVLDWSSPAAATSL